MNNPPLSSLLSDVGIVNHTLVVMGCIEDHPSSYFYRRRWRCPDERATTRTDVRREAPSNCASTRRVLHSARTSATSSIPWRGCPTRVVVSRTTRVPDRALGGGEWVQWARRGRSLRAAPSPSSMSQRSSRSAVADDELPTDRDLRRRRPLPSPGDVADDIQADGAMEIACG